MYPPWNDLNLNDYERIDGMKSLGFVQHHRPDIHIITDQTENDFDPKIIVPEIEKGLSQNKKVALFFWDEDFILENRYSDVLNRALEEFRDEPVYLCSNMDDECLLVYQERRNIPVKPIYIPWWYVNFIPDMLNKRTSIYQGPLSESGTQFACYVNRPDWHKTALVRSLESRNLGRIGDIRQSQNRSKSDHDYYQLGDQKTWKSSHDVKRSLFWDEDLQTWIDHNTRNITKLEQMLGDIPLVINPESNLGLFVISEKSLWPVVLGRMLLIYSRPRAMKTLQKFLSYDLSIYLDLEFDDIDGWTEVEHQQRLECLLDKNIYMITHAREIYHEISKDLDEAADQIGPICYRRFCQSLDEIV